ncbi:phage major tail tube protein [Orrella dioscoreae]|uniref:Phage major tail tube protein n=1 Tax=Orrella dioscoreae TaxID=1851544 RepID=A0A1C3K3F5_9BURK|nr:phage major tail tube protein [Orrella dioscoreae]SBT25968.1 Phage major tail tube protein [Orrella dioscoreae]SOE50874.1 Phage major tail tube protein [Orrella dioscoreae]
MGMPSKLKNLNLYNNGSSYLGVVSSFTPPSLARKTEAWRGGGMIGAAKVDFGMDDDAMQAQWKIGGYVRQVLAQFGARTLDATQLRFAQAYQNDATNSVDNVEIVLRGRHSEIDRGEAKAGEDTEWNITTECVYYKETFNGITVLEIDIMNAVYKVDGNDINEGIRMALGLL